MALSTDDLVAIHQLYAAYCHAIDDGDGQAFASCFTPDGVVGGVGRPLTGSAKIADFAERTAARGPIRHIATNVHVTGSGDEASGRAYLQAYRTEGRQTTVLSTGRYADSLRRVDGQWLFVTRSFTPDA